MILPPALDASFPRRSPQIDQSDRHFGIRCMMFSPTQLPLFDQQSNLSNIVQRQAQNCSRSMNAIKYKYFLKKNALLKRLTDLLKQLK